MTSRSEFARWAFCFAVVACAHVGGAAALMTRWSDSEIVAGPPVITVNLEPIAAAPEIAPPDIPVGPQQVETPPQVEEPPPPPPPEQVSIEPPKPPEPPKKKPPERKKMASLTSAPAPAERRAPVAAIPGASGNSNALPNWKSLLVATLERNKRYPSDARSRGEQGVAQLAFSVDRRGGVHNARIVHSSGSSALDSETLAMVHRAAPLPPPPPEMPGNVSIVVPIRYNMR